MDVATLWVGVSTFLAGGLLGSIAALYATRKESQDRREALNLEREKFEHERDKDLRVRQRECLVDAKNALASMQEFMFDTYNYNPDRLDAMVGEFHEVRLHYGSVVGSSRRLGDFGMESESAKLGEVADAFSEAVRDFSEGNYRSWSDVHLAADQALDARSARIP